MRTRIRIHFGHCEACGALYSKGKAKARKFCGIACYGRYRSAVYRGAKHPNFKGRVSHAAGYVRIYRPGHALAARDGYVLEHRLVLDEAGFEIPDGHHVHHRNGVKSDNRIENLEVILASEHNAAHIRAAGQVTNQYGTWSLRR